MILLVHLALTIVSEQIMFLCCWFVKLVTGPSVLVRNHLVYEQKRKKVSNQGFFGGQKGSSANKFLDTLDKQDTNFYKRTFALTVVFP